VFDTRRLSEDAVCFDGAVYDGRYVYFVPLLKGVVVRYDTKGDFGDPESWSQYDGKRLGMGMNVGAIYDGRYVYFATYANGCILRYDTEGEFESDGSWKARDVNGTSGLDTSGFDGAFFDGRFLYFIPWKSHGAEWTVGYHCNYLRYDTGGDFEDPGSWTARDAAHADGLLSVGYNGGAFDGRYLYAAPLHDGQGDHFHGKILRYDTVGENASFSLRYSDCGHNGGLCAAVPGPSFLVNTVKGPVGVAAHQALQPGWHHLCGVYDGRSIKLFVDGKLVAERSGSGRIQACRTGVSIGRIPKGAARFRGRVAEVRILDVALGDDRIKTEYANLSDPSGFIRARAGERSA
jgi:hypothetical protein